MPTNAMGREAANPGAASSGGRSNADRDRDAARALSGAFGSRGSGGMSPTQLDMKYPGSRKRKSRQYEASLSNLAKVGTIIGSMIGGPAATAAKLGIDAISGDLDMESMLDPFSGRMADVPSTGAGYADSGRKDDTVTGLVAAKKKKTPRPTSPLGSIGTILGNVGGSIRAGGL
jgi:hypothetical protein